MSVEHQTLYLAEDLTGSKADQERHMIVRITFLNSLNSDAKVWAFFDKIAEETGIAKAHEAAMSSVEEVAKKLGITRDEFFFSDSLIKIPREKAVHELTTKALVDFEMFEKSFHSINPESFVSFVRDELRLPWPWLSIELLRMLMQASWGSILGMKLQGEYSLKCLTPAICEQFTVAEGESADCAVSNLIEFVGQILEKIERTTSVAERRCYRTPDVRKLERNAVWFYRHQIRGESIRSIAREIVSGSDSRSTVQDGIKEARRVLGLTPYTYHTCRN